MQVAAPTARSRFTALAGRCLTVAVLSMTALAAKGDEVGDVQKLLSTGRNAEALQKADQFLAAKPRDPMMRFLRAIGLSQAGRTPEAITAFIKLTEDYPELPEPFNNLAVLYAQQGQYDKSRNALEMAIRTNPSYATAYENLGDVYAKLASQAYSKALQIDTRSAVAPKLAMIRELFPKDRNGIAAAVVASASPAAIAPTPTATSTPAAPAAAASTKPAKPTATPTAAAPKPAPSPAPEANGATARAEASEKDIEAALHAWASAWSKKDVPMYFEAYSRDFDGGKGRKAWERERRERILGKRNISVKISNLQVSVEGNKATARFHQDYKADSLSVSSGKRIDLVRTGGQWVIVKESTGS